MVTAVAQAFGNLRSDVVFLGGSVVGFLITNQAFLNVRPTDDVDVVVEVASYGKYQELLADLRKLGFIHDMDGPVCRLLVNGIKVDIMPTQESILQFSNRWYPLAVQNSIQIELSENTSINVIGAPLFVCTKLEAFANRGHGDYVSSWDIEDVIAIINGRDELVTECAEESPTVQEFLGLNFRRFLGDEYFLNALPGLLPYAARNREPIVLSRMTAIASLVRN
jgi:hypothetical protein